MKVGDLVRFKVHHYHKSYGIGVVLGTQSALSDFNNNPRRPRLRVLFNDEQIVARFDELELISEGR